MNAGSAPPVRKRITPIPVAQPGPSASPAVELSPAAADPMTTAVPVDKGRRMHVRTHICRPRHEDLPFEARPHPSHFISRSTSLGCRTGPLTSATSCARQGFQSRRKAARRPRPAPWPRGYRPCPLASAPEPTCDAALFCRPFPETAHGGPLDGIIRRIERNYLVGDDLSEVRTRSSRPLRVHVAMPHLPRLPGWGGLCSAVCGPCPFVYRSFVCLAARTCPSPERRRKRRPRAAAADPGAVTTRALQRKWTRTSTRRQGSSRRPPCAATASGPRVPPPLLRPPLALRMAREAPLPLQKGARGGAAGLEWASMTTWTTSSMIRRRSRCSSRTAAGQSTRASTASS